MQLKISSCCLILAAYNAFASTALSNTTSSASLSLTYSMNNSIELNNGETMKKGGGGGHGEGGGEAGGGIGGKGSVVGVRNDAVGNKLPLALLVVQGGLVVKLFLF